MRHLIIGASAAGITAAKTLRTLKKEDEIVLLSSDTDVHSRCMLHHFMGGHKSLEDVNFAGRDFFDKYSVKWIKGKRAVKVDPDKNIVGLDDGGELAYDKLLIATGAVFVIPPIPNFRTSDNVYGLRDIYDAQKISAAAAKADKCVIVGSGLVGLDAAYALCERGVTCSIVEMADRISPLQLEYIAAGEYQKRFEAAGCTFYWDEKAADSKTDGMGNITSLILASGKEIPCDFVIVAAGVKPAAAFLEGSGIVTNKSVCTDDYMRTNIENIWAAGDVAGITGIWPNAMEQGKVAAENMAGVPTVYDNRYGLKNTMNFFGLTTLSLGAALPTEGDEVYVRESKNQYERFIVRGGTVTGVIIQGDISNKGIWQEIVKNKVSLEDINKSPFNINYADFYKYNPKDASYEWSEHRA